MSTPIGEPHDAPDTTEPGVFTGSDPNADVGEPDNLGQVIGTETSAIGIPHP